MIFEAKKAPRNKVKGVDETSLVSFSFDLRRSFFHSRLKKVKGSSTLRDTRSQHQRYSWFRGKGTGDKVSNLKFFLPLLSISFFLFHSSFLSFSRHCCISAMNPSQPPRYTESFRPGNHQGDHFHLSRIIYSEFENSRQVKSLINLIVVNSNIYHILYIIYGEDVTILLHDNTNHRLDII